MEKSYHVHHCIFFVASICVFASCCTYEKQVDELDKYVHLIMENNNELDSVLGEQYFISVLSDYNINNSPLQCVKKNALVKNYYNDSLIYFRITNNRYADEVVVFDYGVGSIWPRLGLSSKSDDVWKIKDRWYVVFLE